MACACLALAVGLMADWIEDYYDWQWDAPAFIREKRREIAFLDEVSVPQFHELSPSVVTPADPTGRRRRFPAPSSSGQDTGLSRRGARVQISQGSPKKRLRRKHR